PVEVAVLDLVLAEGHGLRAERGRERETAQEGRGGERSVHGSTSIETIGSSCTTASATSEPATTRPNAVYPPSRRGCGEWAVKNGRGRTAARRYRVPRAPSREFPADTGSG